MAIAFSETRERKGSFQNLNSHVNNTCFQRFNKRLTTIFTKTVTTATLAASAVASGVVYALKTSKPFRLTASITEGFSIGGIIAAQTLIKKTEDGSDRENRIKEEASLKKVFLIATTFIMREGGNYYFADYQLMDNNWHKSQLLQACVYSLSSYLAMQSLLIIVHRWNHQNNRNVVLEENCRKRNISEASVSLLGDSEINGQLPKTRTLYLSDRRSQIIQKTLKAFLGLGLLVSAKGINSEDWSKVFEFTGTLLISGSAFSEITYQLMKLNTQEEARYKNLEIEISNSGSNEKPPVPYKLAFSRAFRNHGQLISSIITGIYLTNPTTLAAIPVSTGFAIPHEQNRYEFNLTPIEENEDNIEIPYSEGQKHCIKYSEIALNVIECFGLVWFSYRVFTDDDDTKSDRIVWTGFLCGYPPSYLIDRLLDINYRPGESSKFYDNVYFSIREISKQLLFTSAFIYYSGYGLSDIDVADKQSFKELAIPWCFYFMLGWGLGSQSAAAMTKYFKSITVPVATKTMKTTLIVYAMRNNLW